MEETPATQPLRNRLDAQERAHLEAMLRRNAMPAELAAWRRERGIHHKSFGAMVRYLRQNLDTPPSPMAAQIAALEPAPAPPAGTPNAPSVAITAAPASSPQIGALVEWLAAVRAMRDELAAHGVTVAGSLRIEVEL